MCLGTPDMPEVKDPIRYAQQRTPNRGDTGDAKARAEAKRKRATGTLITQDNTDGGGASKKTMLGS